MLLQIFVYALSAQESKNLPVNTIELTRGFSISVYAENVDGARSMAIGEKGTLFIGTRSDKVYAVVDTNNDKKADEVLVIAQGLDSPNGVALRDGALYVAEISRVIKFENIEENLENPPEPVS